MPQSWPQGKDRAKAAGPASRPAPPALSHLTPPTWTGPATQPVLSAAADKLVTAAVWQAGRGVGALCPSELSALAGSLVRLGWQADAAWAVEVLPSLRSGGAEGRVGREGIGREGTQGGSIGFSYTKESEK